MTSRRQWLTGSLGVLADWPGAIDRQELYSALIVGAKSRATQQALLVASFHDPAISARGWHGLELDAARNRAPRP